MNAEPEIKILLVDDGEDNLVALTALVAADGVRVVAARSGSEALETVLMHDVALALIDVDMPGMDGFELAELLRGSERTRTVPIIFVTEAAGAPAPMFKGYETGAVDFLTRPVEPRLLRSKVETFVQLHRQHHLLSEQLRLSDMFVAALGHDLRSPLQTIEFGAQLILGKTEDAATVQQTAATMQRASRRMARLIEQLLDLARARRQGGIPILPVACDLAEMIVTAVDELEPSAAGRVELKIAGEQRGTWDRDGILQVLRHLIDNAAQHGERETPIAIEIGEADDRVLVEVKNRGHVSPETLATLFDPFSRAATARRHAGGLGLGLYVVDQIVKAHGGCVLVQSSPEAGTSFRVELPRHVSRVAP